jgi:hypothetical protein
VIVLAATEPVARLPVQMLPLPSEPPQGGASTALKVWRRTRVGRWGGHRSSGRWRSSRRQGQLSHPGFDGGFDARGLPGGRRSPESCQERGSTRWSCWSAARGWCSSRVVRSRMSLLISGCPSETLRKYVRQVEANEGRRADLLTSEEREEIRKLRREVFELRRANEILKAASVFMWTPRLCGSERLAVSVSVAGCRLRRGTRST